MDSPPGRNLTWQRGLVRPEQRELFLNQRGVVLWLTGLSGSGKTTIAQHVELRLVKSRHLAVHLDGDNIRHGLCSDLGFSDGDRDENIRRIAEVSRLFAEAGLITIATFISPHRAARERARTIIGATRFVEIHVHAPLSICQRRDPKGLYQMAREGKISQLTGFDAPYEPPEAPHLRLSTQDLPVEQCVDQIFSLLYSRHFIPKPTVDIDPLTPRSEAL